MTASIALGLTVDGTFHFLCIYQHSLRETACRYRAVRYALLHTGMPMMSSGLISGIGLLALSFSPFRPAMRFGVLMFLLMTAATISGLVLFPAFLALGTKRRRRHRPAAVEQLPVEVSMAA
jgi:predicted RND superfamily exporter protein